MLKDFNAQTIKWDKATDRINEIVKANSGDSNGRKLRVQILNNGKVESLAGASLSLAWKTPDEKHKGLDAFTMVDASTGVFEIAYTTGMLSNIGKLSASLVLTTSGGVTESSSFVLFVEQSNVDEESMQSDNSYTALTEAVVLLQGMEGKITSKRDKGVKITNSDLDTSSDNNKIKLVNLSEEVQRAMAGSAPVISTVADKSITKEKYADKSIDGVSLGSQYSFRAVLNNGEDLSTIHDAGTYYFNDSVTSAPVGINGYNFLEVLKAQNRWVIQKIILSSDPSIQYIRRVDSRDNNAREWREMPNLSSVGDYLKSNKIDGTQLTDDYSDRGVTNDIDNELAVGTYLFITSNVIGILPADWESNSGYLSVERFNKRFVIQRIYGFRSASNGYVREIDLGSDGSVVVGEWKRISGDRGGSGGDYLPLKNKVIVCFGDSLTEDGQYPPIIAEKTGAIVHNVGFGGCRMSYHNSQGYDDLSMTSLAVAISTGNWTAQDAAVIHLRDNKNDDNVAIMERLKAIDFNQVDYITINYGANDYSGNVPIGTNEDSNRTTFKGSINYIVEKLLTAYPKLKIHFISPMWRARIGSGDGKDADNFANENGDYLIDFIHAEKEIAMLNKTPFFDLYHHSGVNKYNHEIYLRDGLHGNSVGYELMGSKIASYLIANT